ncbi:hypothetical protein PENTCL1PPCAC_28299, partial [Pristionchus entomophagus]
VLVSHEELGVHGLASEGDGVRALEQAGGHDGVDDLLDARLEAGLLQQLHAELLVIDVGESQSHRAHDLGLEQGVVDERVTRDSERHAVHLSVGLHVQVGSVEEDESLDGVGAVALLQHAGHLESDAGSVGVADEPPGRRRLHFLHLGDVAAGDRLDRVLRHVLRRLEAVRGEVAAVHYPERRRGDTLDGMDEEGDRSLLDLVALHHHVLRVEVVDVDAHLE